MLKPGSVSCVQNIGASGQNCGDVPHRVDGGGVGSAAAVWFM